MAATALAHRDTPERRHDAGLAAATHGGRRRPAAPEGADALAFGPRDELVRVFDHEPDLLAGLDPRTAGVVRRRIAVPKISIAHGAWAPPEASPETERSLGLLVVDGFLIRTVTLAGRDCPELIGPGDLIRPWESDSDDASVDHEATWTALGPATVAVLDDRFAAVACRCPSVISRLMSRSAQRTRSLAFTFAVAHVRRAETRLLMLLWHLADRWGRVTPQGVVLPMRLTHELIAHLACMRRPTASTALQRLTRADELVRRADGTWLLTGAPPVLTPEVPPADRAAA